MKYLFCRRRIISLLCIISVIFGMSAVSSEELTAATESLTFGPYTFVKDKGTDRKRIMLSKYDESKNGTGEVCIEKGYYSSSYGELWVEGIMKTAFQKKVLPSLTVKTTSVLYRCYLA